MPQARDPQQGKHSPDAALRLPAEPAKLFAIERKLQAALRESGDPLYQPVERLSPKITKEIFEASGAMHPTAFQLDGDTLSLYLRLKDAQKKGDRVSVAEVYALAATRLRFRWLQAPVGCLRQLLEDKRRVQTLDRKMKELGLGRLFQEILSNFVSVSNGVV